MDLFPFPLFPDGSLSSSVITTVWVGVMVVAFFNLRLGWVFSGLVVPGYMVPLLLVKPWSAGIVVVDGIITYFIVRFLSERPAFLPYWCSLFGRDRFFALLLVSVIVRLLLDGWVLPIMGEYINIRFGWNIDYRSNLHSFGLIIIALIANQLWKTGFARGVMPLLVTIAVTYVIVRYGLMEFTNFSVGNLRFLYEDLAASVLASPKAYIIVLTTAFLASRMNLLYGWDYNGILIPSLLALQWYQPTKILTTFVEALVILYIARLVLQTPFFTQVNMEGARKLLLFFNISFLMKFALGYLLPEFWPDLKVTDTYGFGYLLGTLIAIRMYDQDLMARLTRATLQTSITAIVAASVVGFALTSFGKTQAWFAATQNFSSGADVILQPEARLSDRLQRDKVLLYQTDPDKLTPSALPQEITRFTGSLLAISNYDGDDHDHDESLRRAATELDAIGYELLLIDGRYAYMRERPPARGRGLFVIDTQAQNDLILEAPAPLDEPGTAEAASVLLRSLGAKGLAIAGTRRNAKPDGSADSLQNRHTLFQVFHRELARSNAVQIRRLDS
ncbi:MAG: poly-gamma-glutamate biosynthesis protein PgsC/CapC, partial [Gammaproteobacteria bacterium]|nr:poly-gamma-glutamate biosynthesis protein PgsC/CapC [Gammaproteobacteria bacterium]